MVNNNKFNGANEINEIYINSLEQQIEKLNCIISNLIETISTDKKIHCGKSCNVCNTVKVIKLYPDKRKVKVTAKMAIDSIYKNIYNNAMNIQPVYKENQYLPEKEHFAVQK